MYWNPCPYLQWPDAVVLVFAWSRETLADPSSSLYWRRHISAATSSNKHTKTFKTYPDYSTSTSREMYGSDEPVLCANPPRGFRYCRWMTPHWCSAHENHYYPDFRNRWNHCYERAEHDTETITWVQKAFYSVTQRFRVCVTSHLQEKFVDHSL